MRSRILKAIIVTDVAVPYVKAHGTPAIVNQKDVQKVTVQNLAMMLATPKAGKLTNRLEIWDNDYGRLVFSADVFPLDVRICKAGDWFHLFLEALRDQANQALGKFLGHTEYLAGPEGLKDFPTP